MIIVIKQFNSDKKDFKIVEHYCSVTPTKGSQLCKAKLFFKKTR